MTNRELGILNSLVSFAAENIPGGLSTEEHEVAFQVAVWIKDGVPVRQICPHCGAPAPRDEGRVAWLEKHVDNKVHRAFWGIQNGVRRAQSSLRLSIR